MKKVILISIFLFNYTCSNSAIRVVNNMFQSPSIYSTLQSAIDASAAYDTIYIQGSNFPYEGVSVKPLVYFGEGALPNQQSQLGTRIQSLTLAKSEDGSTSAAGTKIFGCHIVGLGLQPTGPNFVPNNAYYGAFYGISNIYAERCYIESVPDTSPYGESVHLNLFFKNCYIVGWDVDNMFNSVITNCIVRNFTSGGYLNLSGNNLFSNNVVLGNETEHWFKFPGALVVNNVFNYSGTYLSASDMTNAGCQFSHNIFSKNVNSDGTSTFGENILNAGNQLVQPPNTASEPLNLSYTSSGPFWDLHLLPGSAGVGYGTDGTDVGIYGGAHPWVDEIAADSRFRYFAAPKQIPVLQELNVLNPQVTSSGMLNIQVKAKSQE